MPTNGFHFPFYGGGGSILIEGTFGGAATADRPIPFTVVLDGVEYPIELRTERDDQLYRRGNLDRQNRGVVQSNQPDDSQFNDEGAWWRYAYSWHLGTGQAVQDFGEDFSPNRFSDSRGVDPWEEFCVKLLPDTERLRTVTADNCYLAATGNYVYLADGTGVRRSADLTTWTSLTGLAGTVRAMTTDGSTVYIATSSHIYTCDDSGGVAVGTKTADSDDYQNVAFVGNRLLAGADNVLYEIASGSGAARTAFETHYQSAFRWTAIFSIGSRIYIGGFSGNRSEIYTATVDSSGNLVRSAEAAPFPYGEILNTAFSYGGQAVLCTSLGIRLAALSGDGALSYGPLINAPGNVQAATAEGRFVWFGWEDFFGEGSGVGRLALDTAVQPLQPAYASDVMTPDVSDTIVGVARFGGRTLFSVAGDGVYGSIVGTYVTEGWVESGKIYQGTIEPKGLSSIVVRSDELDANTSLELEISNENDTVLSTFTSTGPSLYGIDASLVGSDSTDTEVQWAKVKLTLSGDGTVSPCLRSWRLRSFPIIPITEEWIVPLIVHRHVVVNDADGQLRSMDQLELVESIIERVKSSTVVPYREGVRTYRVRIDKYEWNPKEWDDTSDFFDGLLVVRLLSA